MSASDYVKKAAKKCLLQIMWKSAVTTYKIALSTLRSNWNASSRFNRFFQQVDLSSWHL